jgi:acyl-CoA synthetase (NDP forming)
LGRPTLSESESKQLLAAWGVGSAREHRATSAEAAVETAEQLEFPVALKVDSPDIPHKTEAGVVRLNLGDAAQVRTAYAEILRGDDGELCFFKYDVSKLMFSFG